MNFLNFLKSLFQLITYTLAYFAGRKSVMEHVEAESAKKSLEEATRVYNERESTKEKYIQLKKEIPDKWGEKAGGGG